MNIVVRQLEVRDIQAVRHVTWETCVATYASFIPEADLRAYFDIEYSITALTELFKNPDITGYIVEIDEVVAGFTCTEYKKDKNRFYISSLYVLPIYQGTGLGQKLLEIAERKARQYGIDRVWLGVISDNITVFSWYKKLGFEFIEESPLLIGKTKVVNRIGYRVIPPETASRVSGTQNNKR
ncbi:MAG: GNAT family N-acetyltransferase [Bacteroidota bacterium]